MTPPPRPLRVAVVGAGLAGAVCARRLADAGLQVLVFDKSRGVGGRLATRRAEWTAPDGRRWLSRFDHGAPGFGAQGAEFRAFAEQAARDGLLARWTPRLAADSYAPLDDAALWVPQPDMPALCRALLQGLPLHTGCTVAALERQPDGWRLLAGGTSMAGGTPVAEGLDAVLIAIPPPQAAALLQPHRPDWAARALAIPMQPGWVLMAVTDAPQPDLGWSLAWPRSGPLALIVRTDAKPGRERLPGRAQWVVHATADWSRIHLESPAAEVRATLQQAAAAWIGRAAAWHHVDVHRWRYASAPRAAAPGQAWWHAGLGLGVCGDALGGGGAEGAHRSGSALADRLLDAGPGSQAQGPADPPPLAPTPRSE